MESFDSCNVGNLIHGKENMSLYSCQIYNFVDCVIYGLIVFHDFVAKTHAKLQYGCQRMQLRGMKLPALFSHKYIKDAYGITQIVQNSVKFEFLDMNNIQS